MPSIKLIIIIAAAAAVVVVVAKVAVSGEMR